MPGFESRAIPSLAYFVERGEWPKLEIDPATGKHRAVGPGGKPPMFAAAIKGEKGSENHRGQALAIDHLAHPDDWRAAARMLDFLRSQSTRGHMGSDFGSPSHCDENYAYIAPLILSSSSVEIGAEAFTVMARELAICLRFEERIRRGKRDRRSVVMVGGRAWSDTKQPWKNGGEGAAVQNSWIRDEGALGWLGYGEVPRGAYVGPDRCVMDMLLQLPREEMLRAARAVDLSTVALVAPVYEWYDPAADAMVRWWEPPAQVVRTRPTCYVAIAYRGGRRDSYICNTEEARRFVQGRTGGKADAVIGREAA